ncbi:hypothetical protein Tco_0235982 [Tanacetum coccineum]
MDDPYITMEEYIQLEEEKARRHGHTFNWETATYGKVRYHEDIDYFKDFETDFPAIVYEDALTPNPVVSLEPMSCGNSDAFTTHKLAHKRNMEDHTEQISGEFLVLILLFFVLNAKLYNEVVVYFKWEEEN